MFLKAKQAVLRLKNTRSKFISFNQRLHRNISYKRKLRKKSSFCDILYTMNYFKTYSNGLRLVSCKLAGMRSVSIGVWVGTGSAFETAKNNGISHFIEHMLFKGTKTRSAYEIADSIDRIGAQINAFTAKECTCYYTKSVDEHSEKCFEVLSDLFFNSVFDETEMGREKGVICEEIKMVEDAPEDVCHELAAEALFHKHALGRRILGPAKNVKAFTEADIRGYMGQYYGAKNVVIAIAGNIEDADAEYLTGKYFASQFKGAGGVVEYACSHKSANKFLSKTKKIEQANMSLVFPSINFNHPDTYALLLFNSVFGASMSCRLFQRIREKLGLAYSVYAYQSAYKNCGMYSIFCGAGPENSEKAVSAVRKEIDLVLKEGITKDEFARGKEQMKSNFILGQESSVSIMNILGKTMLLSGEVFDIDKKIGEVNKVKMDDVVRAYENAFDFSSVCAAYVAPEEKDILKVFLEG